MLSYGMMVCSNFTGLLVAAQLSQYHLLKRLFPLLYILGSFAEDQLAIGVWIYFWALCSLPLIHISVFVPILNCEKSCLFLILCFFPTNSWSQLGEGGASQVGQVKNPPNNAGVHSLGWEDPLEGDGMATHSSILAWRIPWTEEPNRLQFMGLQRVILSMDTHRFIWGVFLLKQLKPVGPHPAFLVHAHDLLQKVFLT